MVVLATGVRGQSNVLTHRYDTLRTGATLGETSLTTSNVNSGEFGLLYTYPADGAIYTQPLYVSALNIPGKGTHNVVFFGTMNDKLYAFDANSNSAALWTRDFTNSSAGVTAIPITDLVGSNSLNIVGNVGIEGTPVINLSTNTMYVVVRTKENQSYVQRLHAIDITTGLDKSGSPVIIQASVKSSASDAVNGILNFDPKMQNQRVAVALANGVVLIAWGSHEDLQPYHGWIMGYNATTLQQVAVFCSTPNGRQGGIWQAGRAPAIDPAGNVYFETGNGDWDGVNELSDSVAKFSVSTSGISLLDWFTPSDQAYLDANDLDLGSTGPLLIPNTNLLVASAKESILYLFNTGNLGHETPTDSGPLQQLSVNGGEMKGGVVYWDSPQGPLVYVQADKDVLRSFILNTSNPSLSPFATGSIKSPGAPGGVLSISANGNIDGTGLVWAMNATSQDDDHGLAAGILRAYNASTLQELWDTEMVPSRDRLGTLVKYVPPIVVNGRVYAATSSSGLRVYGLLSGPVPDFGLNVNSTQTVTPGAAASYTVGVTPANGFNSTVALSVAGLPAGTTANFNPASISGSGNATLQVLTSSSTPSGTYKLTITGVSGSLTHSVTSQLVVSSAGGSQGAAVSIDFVGNGTPMAASESAGVVSKTHWNEAMGAGSSSPLSLVDETGASNGASVTWQADSTYILPVADTPGNARMMKGYLDNGSGNSTTVTVANLPPSPTGYDVYVYTDGDNGAITRTATFTISGSGVTTASTGVTYAAGVVFSGAFTQANNSAGNYVKFSINATGFTLNAIPGTSSDGYKRAPVNGIQIVPSGGNAPPDYSLSVNGTQTVSPGAVASYTVGLTPANGFNSTVALSVAGLPAGTTANFNPASISGSGNATLQVLTSNATPSGTYKLTITGVSGSLTHSVTSQLVVSSAGGSQAAAVSIDFVGNGTPMAATESAGVVSKTHWNEATGAGSSSPLSLVDETGASNGASVTWKADGTWILPVTDSPGNVRMMEGYLDNGSGNSTTVTVANLPPSPTGYDVYVYTDGDNGAITRTATFTISGPGVTTASTGVTYPAGVVFSGAFTQANSSVGNYVKFTISATGFTLNAIPGTSPDGYKRAPVNGMQIVPSTGNAPPDYALSVNGTQTVTPGAVASYTVGITPSNGFNSTVALSVAGLPAGTTANFNPASISGSGNSTLQVLTSNATPSGTYQLTISGVSGSLTHTASTQLVVTSSGTRTAAVSINFVGNGTPMAASESAGVVSKTHWNEAGGAGSSSPLSLVDETGASSGASVTWKADSTWILPVTDSPGNVRMMEGYLDNGSGNSTVVTVSNLQPSPTGYDVYVYTDGDNGAITRTATFTISGPGVTTASTGTTYPAGVVFSGAFTQANNSAGNYVKFTINATGFTLNAIPGTSPDGYKRAPVNGIQVVPH